MKTFLLAIAAVAAVALSAGSAAAQHPGGCTHCSGGHSFGLGHGHGLGLKGHSHGWHPLFSKFGGGHGLFGFGLAGGKFGTCFSNHGHLFGDGHGGWEVMRRPCRSSTRGPGTRVSSPSRRTRSSAGRATTSCGTSGNRREPVVRYGRPSAHPTGPPAGSVSWHPTSKSGRRYGRRSLASRGPRTRTATAGGVVGRRLTRRRGTRWPGGSFRAYRRITSHSPRLVPTLCVGTLAFAAPRRRRFRPWRIVTAGGSPARDGEAPFPRRAWERVGMRLLPPKVRRERLGDSSLPVACLVSRSSRASRPGSNTRFFMNSPTFVLPT